MKKKFLILMPLILALSACNKVNEEEINKAFQNEPEFSSESKDNFDTNDLHSVYNHYTSIYNKYEHLMSKEIKHTAMFNVDKPEDSVSYFLDANHDTLHISKLNCANSSFLENSYTEPKRVVDEKYVLYRNEAEDYFAWQDNEYCLMYTTNNRPATNYKTNETIEYFQSLIEQEDNVDKILPLSLKKEEINLIWDYFDKEAVEIKLAGFSNDLEEKDETLYFHALLNGKIYQVEMGTLTEIKKQKFSPRQEEEIIYLSSNGDKTSYMTEYSDISGNTHAEFYFFTKELYYKVRTNSSLEENKSDFNSIYEQMKNK